MDKITFDEKRIAEGYVNRPWLHKKVIERFVSDCEVTSNFRKRNIRIIKHIHFTGQKRRKQKNQQKNMIS